MPNKKFFIFVTMVQGFLKKSSQKITPVSGNNLLDFPSLIPYIHSHDRCPAEFIVVIKPWREE